MRRVILLVPVVARRDGTARGVVCSGCLHPGPWGARLFPPSLPLSIPCSSSSSPCRAAIAVAALLTTSCFVQDICVLYVYGAWASRNCRQRWLGQWDTRTCGWSVGVFRYCFGRGLRRGMRVLAMGGKATPLQPPRR
jgi:hypothetical protein